MYYNIYTTTYIRKYNKLISSPYKIKRDTREFIKAGKNKKIKLLPENTYNKKS